LVFADYTVIGEELVNTVVRLNGQEPPALRFALRLSGEYINCSDYVVVG